MFDSLKNTINNTVQSVTKQLVAPPTQSQFLERGTLTPAEFIEGGNKMTNVCGSWKWLPAVDPKFSSQYLPKDKQFLVVENVISRQRISDLIHSSSVAIQEDENGDVIINKTEPEQGLNQVQTPEELRFYNLYVIYDHYYYTPRLYLQGTDENSKPLTYDQMKQDIMAEYADKTVTYEYHPHLNIYMATIHPCRHADTLKLLTQQMLENGATKEQIHADNAILIFLKFMGSVIPTISFDFVSEVVIG